MADLQDHDLTLDDDYDEDADSDFNANKSVDEDLSSASEEGENPANETPGRPRKRRKIEPARETQSTELDSGDEATIREQKHARRKGKKETGDLVEADGNESEGWRARTRAMRTQEKQERRNNKLASSKGSTIDVNKIWEEINRPAPLPPPRIEREHDTGKEIYHPKETDISKSLNNISGDGEKENLQVNGQEETINIKRTYKFAGEVHVEERTVLKSSAEAQLWLSQQRPSKGNNSADDGRHLNRPLRKLSRFDPNLSNMDAFKASWASIQEAKFKGPKLNVVEKSKMDWAEHVDTEGLKEELNTHAKAKEGYLTRMDFLKEVEARKEAEARAARLDGH